jgi:murein DD-endopeptidase MepM/ murein hydrolase activator NlpD
VAAAVAGLVLASVALTALPTSAGDLDDEKQDVEQRIDQAHEHLDHSSARLQAATDGLLRAQAKLDSARRHLVRTRGELAAAAALDREMQKRLAAAVARLRQARRELSAGRADVAAQQEHLRLMVVADYQQGDPALLGLSMVFTTQDPAELAGSLNASDDVLNLESTVLDQLEAAEVLLTVEEEENERARQQVAERRRAAAANLRHKESLERLAEDAQRQVTRMVVLRREARSVAVRAKSADLRVLERLQDERDRIEQMIREQASQTGYDGPVDGGGFLDRPVDGYVTSPFGWRTHPIWGYQAFHDGVDFGAGCGTPVRAAAAGTVLETYYQSAWGNRVIIDHGVVKGVGLASISNHLQGYAVSPGDRVSRGQVVGYVGSTGWSTGCHLHFTVMQNGVPVDPMIWI